MVIFLFLLVFSIYAAIMFALGDYSLTTKGVAIGMAVLAIVLQFTPIAQDTVHFLVPLFLQIGVCGWWSIASQFE